MPIRRAIIAISVAAAAALTGPAALAAAAPPPAAQVHAPAADGGVCYHG